MDYFSYKTAAHWIEDHNEIWCDVITWTTHALYHSSIKIEIAYGHSLYPSTCTVGAVPSGHQCKSRSNQPDHTWAQSLLYGVWLNTKKKRTGSRRDGSQPHGNLHLIVPFPSSPNPTFLPLSYTLHLSISASALSRSPYSLFNRHHIAQVHRGFLPANRGNLCLVRGGEAWQVRGAKMGILNGASYSLLVHFQLSRLSVMTYSEVLVIITVHWTRSHRQHNILWCCQWFSLLHSNVK